MVIAYPPAASDYRGMKSTLVFLSLAALCTFASVRADEACCEQPKVNIQARIREIDLNILLRNYEIVQAEIAKIEMQLALGSDEGKSAEQKKAEVDMLSTRRDRLSALKREYVAKLEKLSELALASK